MDKSPNTVWFAGDLSDPWVVSIVDVLSRHAGLVQVHCPDDLPDPLLAPDEAPRLIVLHRHRLTAADARCLRTYRKQAAGGPTAAIVLCIGPYVRYDELERWSGVADLVLPEATAPDILPRHIARFVDGHEFNASRGETTGFRVEVSSSNRDLGQSLVDACALSGYRAILVDDLDRSGVATLSGSPGPATEPVLTIWDVPVLEPDWADRLELRSRSNGPVIAVFGFADRSAVALAKARGAVACLDLPYNVDDLLGVIDRASRALPAEKWPTPARIEPPHRLPPRPRGRRPQQETPAAVPWSDRDRKPTIN